MKKVVFTENAPAPIGPYSQAIENNGMLFISGQIPVDPKKGSIVEGGVKEQTDMVLKNVQAIITAAGYGDDMSKVVKCTIYLKDMSYFGDMNTVYASYFTADPPARAAFAVKELPLDVMVEIEAIAIM